MSMITIEISGCRFESSEYGTDVTLVENAADAQFWTVYERVPDAEGFALADAISDHKTFNEAYLAALETCTETGARYAGLNVTADPTKEVNA
jgi:hypothetical protein